MEEYIKKKDIIVAIMGSPSEAHYPCWYFDKINNLSVYKFNYDDSSNKLRDVFIKVCKSIHEFESKIDSAYNIGINLPDAYTDWIEPVIKLLEFITNAKVYEIEDLRGYSDISLWLYEGGYYLAGDNCEGLHVKDENIGYDLTLKTPEEFYDWFIKYGEKNE